LSLLLLAIGAQLGVLNDESPDWTWISAVLLVDVAHVWATGFRVYFDPAELKRRIWLYSLDCRVSALGEIARKVRELEKVEQVFS
jgi:hypothetical protein